jgi:hypothetical protein
MCWASRPGARERLKIRVRKENDHLRPNIESRVIRVVRASVRPEHVRHL